MQRFPPVTRPGRAICSEERSPFTRFVLLLLTVSILVIAMRSSAHAEEPPRPTVPNALIVLQPNVPTAEAERMVDASGGHVLLVAEPSLLLVSLPANADVALLGAVAAEVARIPVDAPSLQATYGLAAGGAASYWNSLFSLNSAQAGPFDPAGDPLVNDALTGPPRPDAAAAGLDPEHAALASSRPGKYDTSVVMQGRVAVSIFLPESDGDSENWSNPDASLPGEDRVTRVIAEVMTGVQSWIVPGAPANLSFSFLVHAPIPVPFEPILGEGVADSEEQWIGPLLDAVGEPNPQLSTHERMFALNDAVRQAENSDWAVSVFVVDSLMDTDGKFAEGVFGFAYYFGPYMVLTYDNDGWGISRMDFVASHEFGHLFGALDEYSLARQACDLRGGYLDVENQNSQFAGAGICTGDLPCIMRSAQGQLDRCPTTRAQVGWRDSDGDGVTDPYDTPATIAYASGLATITNAQPHLRGSAWDLPYPAKIYRPLSFNSITSMQYKIDGGAWMPLPPLDGALDGEREEFDVALGPLPNGAHCVQVRAENSQGNGLQGTPPLLGLTVTDQPLKAALVVCERYPGSGFANAEVMWSGASGSNICAYEIEHASTMSPSWTTWYGAVVAGAQQYVADTPGEHRFRMRTRDCGGTWSDYGPIATYTASACSAAPDAFEPDVPFSLTAARLQTQLTQRTFHSAGDVDFNLVNLVAGRDYVFWTVNQGGSADTILELMGGPNQLLATNDDDATAQPESRIVWTARQTGPVWLRVRHADPLASGCGANYAIGFTEGDVTAPTGVLSLQGGSSWTNLRQLAVHIDADDPGNGPSLMRYAIDTPPSAAGWVPYAADSTVMLAGAEGQHVVYAELQDAAGNISPLFSANVGLDVGPPTVAPQAAPLWNHPAINVQPNAADALSGVAAVQTRVDSGAWSNWYAYLASVSVSLAGDDGKHEIRVRVRDRAGNVSAEGVLEVTLDREPPVSQLELVSAAGAGTTLIRWGAWDAMSGVAGIDVEYRPSDTPTWSPWLGSNDALQALVRDNPNTIYWLRVRARDRAGNVEAWPTQTGARMAQVGLSAAPIQTPTFTPTPVPVPPVSATPQPTAAVKLFLPSINKP